jgi:single-stranded DNA-binding protein
LRIQVEAADDPGAFALAAVMTGETARLRAGVLKSGAEVIVEGRLKAIRRRLKSGLTETAYEVVAESIEAAEPVGRIK